MLRKIVIILGVLTALSKPGAADGGKPLKPAPGDRCQVCGMSADKCLDSACQLHFRGGGEIFFDSPEDALIESIE